MKYNSINDDNMPFILKSFSCIVIALVLFNLQAKCQTFSEFFFQNKTEKKYLIKQIAALIIYLGELKDGYNIVHGGTEHIGGIKREDFDQHQDYFERLRRVNPSIKKWARVSDIIALQVKILRIYEKCSSGAKKNNILSTTEVRSISQFFEHLTENSGNCVNLMTMVTTDGEVSLKDDERIERMEELYRKMMKYYKQALSYSRNLTSVMVNRSVGSKNLQSLGKLYGLD